MEHLRPEKDGRSWIVTPKSEGWVFERTYPTKWKAHVAIAVWHQGGRPSDYFEAAREEKKKRRQRANRKKKAEEGEAQSPPSARSNHSNGSELIPELTDRGDNQTSGQSWESLRYSWMGTTAILLVGLFLFFGGWFTIGTVLETAFPEWEPSTVAGLAIVIWLPTVMGGLRIYEHFSSAKQETSRDPEQADRLPLGSGALTLSDIGTLLADEARKWAVDSVDSLQEIDFPQEVPDQQVLLEMYILHLAAFVESTQSLGVDGLTIQTEMINSAPAVAVTILEASDAGDTGQMRKRVTDRLDEYLRLAPRGGSTPEFLQFGDFAANCVLGAEDPYAGLLFVRVFQSAEGSCFNLLESLLKSAKDV